MNEFSATLKDRKVIDRAKTLFWKRQQLTETAACARLRKATIDKNLKLIEVVQRTLDAGDLLGRETAW